MLKLIFFSNSSSQKTNQTDKQTKQTNKQNQIEKVIKNYSSSSSRKVCVSSKNEKNSLVNMYMFGERVGGGYGRAGEGADDVWAYQFKSACI